MSLRKRIERLENLAPLAAEHLTIIISFVTADNGRPALVQPDVTYANTDEWRANRVPGESLNDFTERAAVLATRNEWGVAQIILDAGE
jgi:hypothetical protein